MTLSGHCWIVSAGKSRHDTKQMLWQGRRESENVEDERGSSGGRRLVVGGGIGTVVLVIIYLLLGGDPQALFNSQQGAQLSQPAQIDSQAPHDEASKFVAVVLADTEDAWHEIFRQMGRQYQEPKLVLFTDQTRSGCGFAMARAVLSIVRPIDAFTSTLVFTVCSRNAWVQEAISRRPT
jgi:predicted metalloprotease